jgi:hypothetical protein
LLSGHGPETTVGEEKRNNPFVGEAALPWKRQETLWQHFAHRRLFSRSSSPQRSLRKPPFSFWSWVCCFLFLVSKLCLDHHHNAISSGVSWRAQFFCWLIF